MVRTGYRRAAAAAASLMLIVGGIGLLHLPAARPWLTYLAAFCPVETNPALVQPLQRDAVLRLRGERPAPSSATVPLHLLQLQAPALETWARQRGIHCQATAAAFRTFTCDQVPAAVLGRDTGAGRDDTYDLVVSMNESGQTVAVSVLVRQLDATRGAHLLAAVRHELDAVLGAPTRASGDATATALARPFYGASSEYRFSDRIVRVAGTHIPGSGVVVRELYLTGDGAAEGA